MITKIPHANNKNVVWKGEGWYRWDGKEFIKIATELSTLDGYGELYISEMLWKDLNESNR